MKKDYEPVDTQTGSLADFDTPELGVNQDPIEQLEGQ